MSKFTPGPWRHRATSYIDYIESEQEGGVDVIVSGEIGTANARLIAAAPELYELLRELLDSRSEHFIDNDVLPGWDERARAALAKVDE